jgi:hypothetical protein
MHKDIKRFPLDGIMNDDSDFIRLRAQFETLLIHQMRSDGYIPVLDLGPMFSTLLRSDGHYDFELTVYGVYVGKVKAWKIEGMDGGGKYLPRSTAKSK